MNKKSAVETLKYLIEFLLFYLNDFKEAQNNGEFISGERTAYIECLEIVQKWEQAHYYGLDFDIEGRYPV